jgi:hypothetical protein
LHILAPMPSVLRELRRRVRAEQSLPRFKPSLPRVAHKPPAGPGWIHEIKHDGLRILAHRQGRAVRLLTRNGNDLANLAFRWLLQLSWRFRSSHASSTPRRSSVTRTG